MASLWCPVDDEGSREAPVDQNYYGQVDGLIKSNSGQGSLWLGPHAGRNTELVRRILLCPLRAWLLSCSGRCCFLQSRLPGPAGTWLHHRGRDRTRGAVCSQGAGPSMPVESCRGPRSGTRPLRRYCTALITCDRGGVLGHVTSKLRNSDPKGDVKLGRSESADPSRSRRPTAQPSFWL